MRKTLIFNIALQAMQVATSPLHDFYTKILHLPDRLPDEILLQIDNYYSSILSEKASQVIDEILEKVPSTQKLHIHNPFHLYNLLCKQGSHLVLGDSRNSDALTEAYRYSIIREYVLYSTFSELNTAHASLPGFSTRLYHPWNPRMTDYQIHLGVTTRSTKEAWIQQLTTLSQFSCHWQNIKISLDAPKHRFTSLGMMQHIKPLQEFIGAAIQLQELTIDATDALNLLEMLKICSKITKNLAHFTIVAPIMDDSFWAQDLQKEKFNHAVSSTWWTYTPW